MKLLIFGYDEWSLLLKKNVPNYDINTNNNDDNYDNYDIVIPLIEHNIIDCIERKLHHKSLICYNKDIIELCQDKLKFQNFMQEYFPNYIPKIVNDIDFPFVLKKTKDSWGKNSYVINNIEEYNQLKSQDHFCQEAINSNNEFATHMIYNNGIKFIKTVKYKCKDELFIKGKNYSAESTEIIDLSQKYVKIFDEILKKMNFRGPCCIDHKIIGNKLIIFEINPRFGGSAIYYLSSEIIKAYIDELI